MWTKEEKANILEDCRRGKESHCPRDRAVLEISRGVSRQPKVFIVLCPICKDGFTEMVNRSTEQFSDKETEGFITQHLRDLPSTCPHDGGKVKVEPTKVIGKKHYSVTCDYCGRVGMLDYDL